MAAMAAGSSSPSPPLPEPPSQLHNTSFTLTRLTPLCDFNPDLFGHYTREFRNIVAGDAMRGVNISAQQRDRAKPALVKSCQWDLVNDLIPDETFSGVVIKVAWDDGGSFTAILLPNFISGETQILGKRKRGGRSDPDSEFNSLPLLLTRGPQLVTQQLIDYLTTRFDCRASNLQLQPELLAECLQGYLERVFEDRPTPAIERKVRLLELVFSIPESKENKVKGALRKITLSLNTMDVEQLYRRSPTLLESLTKQIAASTAISLSALKLSRFACAGMLIDASGKLKIFENAGTDGTKFIMGKIVVFAAKEAMI